jgi:DNA repair protein SbcC/Rad50
MRPVLLEMAGFASFREPTVVDFRDTEYFALVGPTGSGKSTVIDAMTFALYGSVPRWDDRRTVALALAPTVVRGTVRLVFDVGGGRYVVARELRRAASGAVTVRGARLERLPDRTGVGGADEETEPLADGGPAVTRAVEELLGLPFGDFTTCVVLPQGDFAEFLHTEPRKRQEKLVRILGLGVYDVIEGEANKEAAAQKQRAEVLAGQLEGYADATAAAEREAEARVAALVGLAERVGAAVPELVAAATEVVAASGLVERLGAERAQLAAVTVPADLAGLHARQRAAAAAVAGAHEDAAAAEAVDTAARERLATAPARGSLQQARRDHAELGALLGGRPAALERQDKAEAAYGTAVRDAADARVAVDTARAARDTAAGVLAAGRERVRRLTEERSRLAAVRAPAGLEALDQRRRDSAVALDRARSALAAAEDTETHARAQLAAAPARGPLEQALRDHRDLAAAREAHAEAVDAHAAAGRDLEAAGAAVAQAREHLRHARERRAAGARANLAAALRPALVAGQECPVCAQAVATLPAPLPDTDLAPAERAVAAAEQAHDAARRRETAAAGAEARAAGALERLAEEVERLGAALAGAPPTLPAVAAELGTLDRLAADVAAAEAGLREARRAREAAAREVEAVRGEAEAAAGALRAARDPLVPLGAPAADDVTAGWAALLAWASSQLEARDDELAQVREAVAADTRKVRAGERALAATERAAARRREEETVAAGLQAEARAAVVSADRRITELEDSLAGGPTDAEAAGELERIDALEAAARAADSALRKARGAARAAATALDAVEAQVARAWDALRGARDPLVPLGAPAVSGADLLAAWTALAAWAAREAAIREERLAVAVADAAAAGDRRDAGERRLADDLAAHAVPVAAGRPLADTAPSGVAAAVERARGVRERIAERRATAERIAAERDDAESAQRVAKMLGNLLRSDGFPRWLVASALDALVADASGSLAELSGGQFELTHADGEFLVIDHADADAQRPVKTLSGGETFQASLALALALSAQMSGLAARGAARLESIFLDEGFGTLDEANLEVVAGTLENLAARGDRMVGVITHVPALAERVPVRYVVNRDRRTSSVVRETL